MAHTATGMPIMKHPTKGFRQIITGIDNAGAMTQDDVTLVSPFLNSEMLDFNVACTWSGPILVDHGNRGLIVNEKGSRTRANGFQLL